MQYCFCVLLLKKILLKTLKILHYILLYQNRELLAEIARATSSKSKTTQILGRRCKSTPNRMEKRIDMFEVPLMAKSNISTTELTKITRTKGKILIVDMEEATANKKAIIVLSATKTITEKFPTNIAKKSLTESIKNCERWFGKSKQKHWIKSSFSAERRRKRRNALPILK